MLWLLTLSSRIPSFGSYLGTKFLRLEFERDVKVLYQWLILVHHNSLKAKVWGENVCFGIVLYGLNKTKVVKTRFTGWLNSSFSKVKGTKLSELKTPISSILYCDRSKNPYGGSNEFLNPVITYGSPNGYLWRQNWSRFDWNFRNRKFDLLLMPVDSKEPQ